MRADSLYSNVRGKSKVKIYPKTIALFTLDAAKAIAEYANS